MTIGQAAYQSESANMDISSEICSSEISSKERDLAHISQELIKEEIKTIKKIELNAEFESFLELRDSIDKYQRENSVQLIVKDSKLLKAESTRKIIPKVYHLVNQSLMYHSIIYCCKCHGELKQKPNTRVKNVGQKRLNCPMYMRFKLTPDLKKLILFDMNETHNHGVDINTIQMTPRQQVYRISRMKRKRITDDSNETIDDSAPIRKRISDTNNKTNENDASVIGENMKSPPVKNMPKINSSADKVPRRSARMKAKTDYKVIKEEDNSLIEGDKDISTTEDQSNLSESPLDSDSTCSDSDEEEIRKHRQLLPFPIRLIGSAIKSSPELLECTKQLIDIQKSKLLLEKQKLILETKHLELANAKLELEVRMLKKKLSVDLSGTAKGKDTTIYLQAN